LPVPGVLWAEQRDGELHIVLQSRPSAAGAELTRAVRSRIRIWFAEELHGTLLGLLDEVGEAVGIGILQRIDFANHRLDVLTAEGITEVRGIHWSRTRLGSSGDLRRVSYTTL
jgi:polynucleotide 5'-kinase involved in rRNA processing